MRSALSRRLLALALTVAIAAPASAFPPDAFQPDVQLPSVGQGVDVQPNQQPAPIPSGPQNIGRDAVARLPDADRAIAAPLLQAGDAAASALGLGRDQYSISVNLQTRTATVVPNAGSAVGDGPIRVTVSPDNPGQFQATMSARQFAGSDAGRALFSRAGAPAMDGAAGRSMVTVGFQTVDGVARVTSVTASRGASDSLFGNRGQGDTPREMTPIEREAVRLVAGANPPANVQVRTAPGNPNSISVTMTARDFVSSPAARQLLPGGPADAEALRGPAGLALVTINVERQGGELRVTGLSVDRGAGASLFGQQRVTDLSTPQPAAPPRITGRERLAGPQPEPQRDLRATQTVNVESDVVVPIPGSAGPHDAAHLQAYLGQFPHITGRDYVNRDTPRITGLTLDRASARALLGRALVPDTPFETNALRLVAGDHPPAGVRADAVPGDPSRVTITMTARQFAASPAARELQRLNGFAPDMQGLQGPAGDRLVTVTVSSEHGRAQISGISMDSRSAAVFFGDRAVSAADRVTTAPTLSAPQQTGLHFVAGANPPANVHAEPVPGNPNAVVVTMTARQFVTSPAAQSLSQGAPDAAALAGPAGDAQVRVTVEVQGGTPRVTAISSDRAGASAIMGPDAVRGAVTLQPATSNVFERNAVRAVAGANPPHDLRVEPVPGNPNVVRITMTTRQFANTPAARQLLPGGGTPDAAALAGPAGDIPVTIHVERRNDIFVCRHFATDLARAINNDPHNPGYAAYYFAYSPVNADGSTDRSRGENGAGHAINIIETPFNGSRTISKYWVVEPQGGRILGSFTGDRGNPMPPAWFIRAFINSSYNRGPGDNFGPGRYRIDIDGSNRAHP